MSEVSIPQHWEYTEIGNVADIIAGGTPKASDATNFAAPGTAISWLTPADLSGYSQKFISHGKRDLSLKGLESSSAKIMPAGTILFSSRAPIGYVAIASNEISTNQGFKSFVLPKVIDSSFAYYFMRSIKNLAESRGTGTTFKEISGASAKKLPFVIAPFAEQKVIAAKLDELLAQVETIKARLKAVPIILKRFRQSVLGVAVSGCLTEGWRSDNNLAPPKQVEFEELFKDKKNFSYGVLKPGEKDPSGVPMIRVMDLSEWGKFSNTEIFKISKNLSNKFKRTIVEQGDIVLSVMATVGRAAIVPEHLAGANVNRALAVIKLNESVSPEFLLFQLMGPAFQYEFVTKQIGTAQKRINLADLRKFTVWLPAITEQNEIVSRVEQLFTFADQIEHRLKNAQARVNHLTQSILAKAFNGELTTEWRKQNPVLISGKNSAEALLEVIRIEKEVAEMTKRISKKTGAKKVAVKMKQKEILSVIQALKSAGKPVDSQTLLAQAGYPTDASVEELERFFLDIREQLMNNKITKVRSGNEDVFSLA